MLIIGIDPGPVQSAVVTWGTFTPGASVVGILPNADVIRFLKYCPVTICAIEDVACYGMPVGKEVFDTAKVIGVFRAARQDYGSWLEIDRRTIKLTLCGNARAKDSNIRQRLIDLYGPVGTKKNPGPLYGVKSHLWCALAVAVVAAEMQKDKTNATGVNGQQPAL
jgi:hypothetical protein